MGNSRTRGGIDLAIGGDEWRGFTFSSYGRARNWRINTPGGESIQACELSNLHAERHDLAYLRSYSNELAQKLAGSSMSFSGDESRVLRVALQLLTRELPVNLARPAQQLPLLLQLVK